MKSAVNTRYGPPEVVRVVDTAAPVPGKKEVLIKIHATTVNRTDCGFHSAEYFISRFFSGLFKPKYRVLGCEFAGEIVMTGESVNTFKVGDRVFGYDEVKFGSHAQYKVIAEDAAIVTIPGNMSYEEAAPITEGAHYALCDIRAAKIGMGSRVLVYGATGAIGSAAVQLLKCFGAEVTAVCNTKNVELVKGLGADDVIDYAVRDFTETHKRFDLVFDAVGGSSFGKCKLILKSRGMYISTEFGKMCQNPFFALVTPFLGGKKVLFPIPTISKDDVLLLKQLAADGKFRPVVDRTYVLDDIVAAYQYVETRQKTGNVVIKVNHPL